MGIDEVGTARALREHRAVTDPLVTKHGGRVVKTTGDGVLLEFPSVIDAVECAAAVQTVMAERNEGIPQDQRMIFRIGINLGDLSRIGGRSWRRQRNKARARIKWMFTTDKARAKLARAYPDTPKESKSP